MSKRQFGFWILRTPSFSSRDSRRGMGRWSYRLAVQRRIKQRLF
jgi:hypothetical protein